MHLTLRHLFFTLTTFSLAIPLHADEAGNRESEQHRFDRIRQEQLIEEKHIEELHEETQRLEQENVSRELDQNRHSKWCHRRELIEGQWERDHQRD